ncbi:MAG: methylated-DNA--[protein]-cysteine S-methyltransferase [Clostridia bacterium]|nr:methylated-DNA--[protein]-cysteine S-methyltransferase [Clostridia bacterium]
MNEYIRFYESPAGRLTLVSDGKALNALLLQKETEGMELSETTEKMPAKAEKIFALAERWLDDYFAGKKCENPQLFSEEKEGNRVRKSYVLRVGRSNLIIEPEGSDFRQEVWKILCEIPYGKTITYGDIAKRMARLRGKKKMAAQAVGGAVGHNPVSIMIPCHRVVGTGGNLTGYGGGMPMKIQLIRLEGMDMNDFTIPTKGTKL